MQDNGTTGCYKTPKPVIASVAKQSRKLGILDCFAILAMTANREFCNGLPSLCPVNIDGINKKTYAIIHILVSGEIRNANFKRVLWNHCNYVS